MMDPCNGDYRVEIVPPYAGQAEVCFENIPPAQSRRHNEIREGDLLICRDALYETTFEGYIQDPSRFETLDQTIKILNFGRTRGIIIGVGMDKVVVIPESFLVRRRHGSPRWSFPELDCFAASLPADRVLIRASRLLQLKRCHAKVGVIDQVADTVGSAGIRLSDGRSVAADGKYTSE